MYTEFDKREVYDAVIAQKVEELIQLCNKDHLPVFITVCVKNDEKGTEYRTDMYSSASNGIKLKNDLMPNFVNVLNGFATVPPTDIVDIDFD